MQLNIGAGSDIKSGFINVDAVKLDGVDVVHDLDTFPWPWDDGSVERIRAYDVFEHVWYPLEFMRECWRVLAPGGVLDVHTVHWKSPNYHRDPDHKRGCDEQSFDYWIQGTFLNQRYGAAYAQGCNFEKLHIGLVNGLEIAVMLRKIA